MKEIIWVKWQDPLEKLLAEKLETDEDTDDIRQLSSGHSFIQTDEQVPTDEGGFVSIGPFHASPAGYVPLHESNLPSALFNFWMGHTNFGLDEELQDVIEEVAGVETLDIFTRYRMRIAIGKSFDQDLVKRAIFRAVNPDWVPPLKRVNGKNWIKSRLSKKDLFWAIFTMPNKQIRVVHGQTPEEVKRKSEPLSAKASDAELSWE